ncbi:MAG: type II toxin-antitoxin system Phd/YefM family antitoxin [Methylotenera sp.]|nr:type II toxin-antitoxin system Phd/YefM family antitoxin [Methylotenera sp.]
MAATWQLQEAKNRFSEVVEEAIKHGREAVVVMSVEEYHRMKQPQKTYFSFFKIRPCMAWNLI